MSRETKTLLRVETEQLAKLRDNAQQAIEGEKLAGQSLTACSKEADVAPAPLTNAVTIDLTTAANAALKSVGGYVVTNNIVVANTAQGYVATTVVCSHEGQRQVQLRNGEFYCPTHGARFDLTGKGLNGNGSRGLTVYKVAQSGSILTIS